MVGAVSARIGVVVTDAYSPQDPDLDTVPLLAALRAEGAGRGVSAEPVVWHREQDWGAFDLLLLRSPWDYPSRPAEFLAWLDRAEGATTVLNPPDLVRWNLDKHYLADLANHGVAVVPTTYHRDGTQMLAALQAHLTAAACDLAANVVVKPTVGASAHLTGLFHAADPAALRLAQAVLATGSTVMLQPEIPELSAGAEKALYLIEGRPTHAVAKGALLELGGRMRGGVYTEQPELVATTDREERFAQEVLQAVCAVTGHEVPLYARVDMVDSADDGLVLLEVELVEPALNLPLAPAVACELATAVLARLPG